MAGPFTKLIGVSGTGPIFYCDEVMDAGTRCVLDFREGYTWPGGVAVTPMSIAADYKTFDALGGSLFEGQPAKVNYAFANSGGDVIFSTAAGQNRKVLLPDPWKLKTGLKQFFMTLWLQMAPTISNGYNNRVAGAGTTAGGDLAWELTPVGDGGNTVVDLIWYVKTGDAGWSLSTIPGFNVPARLFNSARHQISLMYRETADGTYFDQFFALDGVLIGARPSVPKTGAFPAVGAVGDAHIGCPAGIVGGAFVGNFNRGVFEDLTLTPGDWLEMVKIDYDANKTRLA